MTKLFLDCEWADLAADQLVSLALVTEDGQDHFYAEVHPLPTQPTGFVSSVVYPLLERGASAVPHVDFTRVLRRFLGQFPKPFVLYDHPNDGKLFRLALDGFGNAVQFDRPPLFNETLVQMDDIGSLIERYFLEHPEKAERRHHAGVDAEALRWACMEGAGNRVTPKSLT